MAEAAPNPLKGILVLSNLASVTLPVPIAVTPVLVMVTSPVTGTAVATFELLPIIIFPLFNEDPIGEPPAIGVVVALVILPFESTVIVGTAVADP